MIIKSYFQAKINREGLIVSLIIVPLSLALGFKNDFFFLLILVSILSFTIYLFIEFRHKIYLDLKIYFVLAIILIYGLYGIGNSIFLKDFKIPLLWVFYYIVFFHLIRKSLFKVIYSLVLSNSLIALVYIVLSFLDIYNPYSNRELPEYMSYRVQGPALVGYYIVPFIYALYNLKLDRLYFINLILGVTGIILNGSLQSIVIFSFSYLLSYIKISGPKDLFVKTTYISIVIVISVYLFGQFSQAFKEKLNQLAHPLQSPTVMTRIYDLAYMLNETTKSKQEIIIGSGFGVQSNVTRVNLNDLTQQTYSEFHEIDNGFFYIYHRAGVFGLMLLLTWVSILTFKIPSAKARLLFLIVFIVNNLLSIHFWVYPVFSIYIALIISYRKSLVKNEKKYYSL